MEFFRFNEDFSGIGHTIYNIDENLRRLISF